MSVTAILLPATSWSSVKILPPTYQRTGGCFGIRNTGSKKAVSSRRMRNIVERTRTREGSFSIESPAISSLNSNPLKLTLLWAEALLGPRNQEVLKLLLKEMHNLQAIIAYGTPAREMVGRSGRLRRLINLPDEAIHEIYHFRSRGAHARKDYERFVEIDRICAEIKRNLNLLE